MFDRRQRHLVVLVANVLLFYKIAAFSLADNGANLRSTFTMLDSFLL